MPYATATDLLKRFAAEEIAQRADRTLPRLVTAEMLTTAAAGGDLSGYEPDEQAAVAAVLGLVNDALADASAEVDSYLGKRYGVPLAPVPALILRLTCDLARYQLYDDQVTEVIQKRRDDAIANLRDISAGRADLGVPVTTTPTEAGLVEMVATPKVFGRGGNGGLR